MCERTQAWTCTCVWACARACVLCMTLFRVQILTVGHENTPRCICVPCMTLFRVLIAYSGSWQPKCVCVCVSVCHRTSCSVHTLFISWKSGAIRISVLFSMYVLCGFCWKRFVQKFWRDFMAAAEVAGHLCLLRFSMNSRWTKDFDSDGFFSRRLACRTNNRSFNSTNSSLVTVDYPAKLLGFLS